MRCDQCDVEIPSTVVRSCWDDRSIPDHRGLCCSCFDVGCGKRPPVVIGLRTAASLYWPEDITEIK